eukprot:TRINITY_DN5076_c1_g2_i1.p1 TRINITY_DN5076_c1_g2~~TRINITY_DN5076_c1_g2_i1.p1  ORF type:complete len:871 (-),score=151.29 TRINITY_DN5076_c1_g2_i1:61-2529(-)
MGEKPFTLVLSDLSSIITQEHERRLLPLQRTIARLRSILTENGLVDPHQHTDDDSRQQSFDQSSERCVQIDGYSSDDKVNTAGRSMARSATRVRFRNHPNKSKFATPILVGDETPRAAPETASLDSLPSMTELRPREQSKEIQSAATKHFRWREQRMKRSKSNIDSLGEEATANNGVSHPSQVITTRTALDLEAPAQDVSAAAAAAALASARGGAVSLPVVAVTPATTSPQIGTPNDDLSGANIREEDVLFNMRSAWKVDESRLQQIERKENNSVMPSPSYIDLKMFQELTSFSSDVIIKDRCVINPASKGRLCWELLGLLCLMYDLMVVPLQAFDLPETTFMFFMDCIILVYWTFDVPATIFTGIHVEGKLDMRLKTIVKRYAVTWLPFDILVLVPEWTNLLLGGENDTADSTSSIARTLKGARFFRLLRLVRLLRIVKIDALLQKLKERVNSNYLLLCISIGRLLTAIVVLIHFLACAWYALGKISAKGWIYQENIVMESIMDRYVFSFQWSMARLHPSTFGENLSLQTSHERILAIVVSLCALGGSGAFISSITNMMAKLQAFRQQRTRKMWVIREYVQDNHISMGLASRLKKYVAKSFDRKIRQQHAMELEELLPMSLLMDLRFEILSRSLTSHYFFSLLLSKHPRSVWELCRRAFEEVHALSRDIIFTTGDVCFRTIFPLDDELRYAYGRTLGDELPAASPGEADNDPAAIVVPSGKCACEAVLWTPWENCGELRAVSDSTILALEAAEFNATMIHQERAMIDIIRRSRVVLHYLNTTSDQLSDFLSEDLQTVAGDRGDSPRSRSDFTNLLDCKQPR